MILVTALLAGSAGPLAAEERGRDRPGDMGRHGRPQISIEPYIDLSRPERPNLDAPDTVMAELGQCARAGVRSFVDCLRPNHGPVMIRRLEACVQSETIPDDPRRVEACLPPARLR
ncbi:hypothetical protein [Hyphomicrobium sp. CS1GBMeth3]|uniref:hypothetical protein n=1 Tax=Hyphomicrobium sp. CS1GBMeth3 TaxID=1892845 RepID=UPI00111503D8|nr:hypothetical protein [Hyphomicrobium sp. CS1GBMeth3]